jgi:hypothetical protein
VAKQGLAASVTVIGLTETLAALRKMPDDAKNELKDTSFDLAQSLAKALRAAARAEGQQAALMADTVSTGTDSGSDSDLPVVQAGGSSKVGRKHKPAYKLLFGSEFGAHKLKQYKGFNSTGYWFFPTVSSASDEIATKWDEAAQRVIAAFSEE